MKNRDDARENETTCERDHVRVHMIRAASYVSRHDCKKNENSAGGHRTALTPDDGARRERRETCGDARVRARLVLLVTRDPRSNATLLLNAIRGAHETSEF